MRTKKNDSKAVSGKEVVRSIEKTKKEKVVKVKKEKYDVKLVTAVKTYGLKNSNRLSELMSLLKSYHSVPLNSITESDLELQVALYDNLMAVEQTIKKFL